jgi:hypothetical protein
MAERVELKRNMLLWTLIKEGLDALEALDEAQLLKFVLLKKGFRELQRERVKFIVEIVSQDRT